MKPILKWVGGKTQILDKVLKEFPREMNNYREIFLGGGSVLLGVLENPEIKIKGCVYAYDSNEALVNVYKNIQSKHEELYKEIQSIGSVNEERYYELRKEYNELQDKSTVKASALFIVLNKTCFRGVFRVGPNGFNVPYGHYKNPEIINKEHLEQVHKLIKRVTFECLDFKRSLSYVSDPGDFVYLDPPYVDTYGGYTRGGFDEHIVLFELVKKLPAPSLMSNSDVKLVRDSFEGYTIRSITCRRSINSKNPESKAKEVLVSIKPK
jgi:DNA adenine methylase